MQPFRADLHVHTVLSPCADIEMIPPLIVQRAIENGINLIAITDHNATANIAAVWQAAHGTDLRVLAGVELQTAEEVHVLCLFDSIEQAEALQAHINAALPAVENNIDFFGEQFVVDATGDFIRREERMLLTSTSLTLNDAWNLVSNLDGLLIPAHVNRKAFGLLPTLGFVPPDTPLEILEISPHLTLAEARQRFTAIAHFALVQNGDAHFLEDIRGPNQLEMETCSVAEIRLAVLQQDSRTHRIVLTH